MFTDSEGKERNLTQAEIDEYSGRDLLPEDITVLRYKNNDMSKTELARRMGVSRVTIHQWEKPENPLFKPTKESQVKLKQVLLGIDPPAKPQVPESYRKESLLDEMDRLIRDLKDSRISSQTEYGKLSESVRIQLAGSIDALRGLAIESIRSRKESKN